ncbi:hypothetical protein NKH18_45945 [Streptomyces sp. M10(2022)]
MAVGCPERDAVTALDAEREQRLHGCQHVPAQLRVGQPYLAVHDRLPLREGARGEIKDAGNRQWLVTLAHRVSAGFMSGRPGQGKEQPAGRLVGPSYELGTREATALLRLRPVASGDPDGPSARCSRPSRATSWGSATRSPGRSMRRPARSMAGVRVTPSTSSRT